MFMKIFTVLIISFNNIFIIPQNINNTKRITQLIRNKRQNNQVSEINLTKAEFTIWKNETPYKPAPAWKTELQFLLNDIEKQSGIKSINPIEELCRNHIHMTRFCFPQTFRGCFLLAVIFCIECDNESYIVGNKNTVGICNSCDEKEF